jgi:hypothetical protein
MRRFISLVVEPGDQQKPRASSAYTSYGFLGNSDLWRSLAFMQSQELSLWI